MELFKPHATEANTFEARKFKVAVEVASIAVESGGNVKVTGNLNGVGDFIDGTGIPVTEDMLAATAALEKLAKLANAGFTDIDTALSATAKTMNAYGMGVEDIIIIEEA